MPAGQQGIVSNYPVPRPVNIRQHDGAEIQTVNFADLERWVWKVNTALTNLDNPAPSPVTALNAAYDVQLQAAQSGSIFSNIGATFEVDFTLPPATPQNPPLSYTFFVSAAHVLKIIASAGAKIQNGATTSAANGHTQDSTSGDAVTLVCLSTNLWVCTVVTGTGWTTA